MRGQTADREESRASSTSTRRHTISGSHLAPPKGCSVSSTLRTLLLLALTPSLTTGSTSLCQKLVYVNSYCKDLPVGPGEMLPRWDVGGIHAKAVLNIDAHEFPRDEIAAEDIPDLYGKQGASYWYQVNTIYIRNTNLKKIAPAALVRFSNLGVRRIILQKNEGMEELYIPGGVKLKFFEIASQKNFHRLTIEPGVMIDMLTIRDTSMKELFVPDDVSSELTKFYLSGNPFDCTKALRLFKQVDRLRDSSYYESPKYQFCHNTPSLDGKSWAQLTEDDFRSAEASVTTRAVEETPEGERERTTITYVQLPPEIDTREMFTIPSPPPTNSSAASLAPQHTASGGSSSRPLLTLTLLSTLISYIL